MKFFLHWEYRLSKALASLGDNAGLRNEVVLQAHLQNIANFKIAEYPVPIDDIRLKLGLDPHPDTRFPTRTNLNRGAAFLSDTNVDHVTDSVIPNELWALLPQPVKDALNNVQ